MRTESSSSGQEHRRYAMRYAVQLGEAHLTITMFCITTSAIVAYTVVISAKFKVPMYQATDIALLTRS